MNKAYRLLWNSMKEIWIVVAENVKSKGSFVSLAVGSTALLAAVLCGALPASALDPGALPTGGQIVAGSGSIVQNGSAMTVTQTTGKIIANWNSFNIGQNASVTFQQPNAVSVALNRISDQNPSQIMGSLSANGQVFLLNPSGIIFGQTAQVNVGALVASSLNLSNENFLNGTYRFENAGVAGAIINQGSIRTADGGYVAFLAPQVRNEGSITANQGSVVMAAAEKVSLDFTGDGLLTYSVEQGAVDALAENKGLIKADGGLVVMTAKAADSLTQAVVNNEGMIEAQTIGEKNGRILLLSDMENGETVVGGRLDATAPNGGDGGFIETSGATVTMADNLKITANSAFGNGGLWLIDPYDYTIGATEAGYIKTALDGGTSVTIDTANPTESVSGNTINGSGTNGDISINSSIITGAMSGDATLTFKAARHITLASGASIDATQNSNTRILNIQFWADSDNSGDGINQITGDAIKTNGGWLKFGNNQTATINGTSTLVGGDVFFNGSAAQTIATNGGTVDIYGETIISNSSGVTLNSNGGDIRFYGLLNSGNQYSFVNKDSDTTQTWDDARTEAKGATGGGSAVGDTYLVNITSRLENAIAGLASGYTGAWIGAYRPNYTTGTWVWADGPEAGKSFFTQNSSGGGGTVSAGYYANFGSGEPNGDFTPTGESRGQFYGTAGQWNDLPATETFNNTSAAAQYQVHGYVKETNLNASPLTINAGAGNVTFSGAVGTSKALASLNVTSTGDIAINGGAVTTEGAQTYNGNVTLGSAATTLTQTTANTDFTIQAGKTITNAYSADAALTIKTTGSILMNSGSSISSSTGKLNTILWSDSDNSGNGYIFVHDGNTISTNGGNIVMAGGLDDGANGGTASDGTPDGYAISTSSSYSGVSIGRNNSAATSTTTLTSGGGNILMRGKSTGSSPSMGIHFAYGGTLNAGSGTLTMLGEATSYAGIELSAWLDGAGTNYLDITAGTVDIRGITSSTGNHGLASSQLNNEYTRITAGAGGIYLYGNNTANTDKGVEISLNATTTGGGNITVESPNYIALYAGANAHSFNAGSGNTTLKTNTLSIGANHTLSGSGTLTVEPYSGGRAINIGTTPAGSLNIASSYFSTNFSDGFSGITIGNATAGAIAVDAATTFRDKITLLNSSTIALNGAVTANENLTLTGNGAITQSAALAVAGTTAITAGAANSVTLANTGNDFSGSVSVVSGNDVSLIDSNAMTLGVVNATGTIDIATLTGDLTFTGAISTSDTTANAIKLNAGKSTAAGTATGGDIVVSGGSISLIGGGAARATLFTGNLTNANLTTLVGSGSDHFRYNADETTDFSAGSWTNLGSGTYAVYRQQPTVTTTASNDTKTYNGIAYSGGNGVTYSGFVNGDTSAALGGTLTYGGTSQGAINAGSYTITPSGYTNGLGYALAYADGTLTITGSRAPAPQPFSNPLVGQVLASITSPQQQVNGTQEQAGVTDNGTLEGGTSSMGPGSGSGIFEGTYMDGLIIDRTGYRTEEKQRGQL